MAYQSKNLSVLAYANGFTLWHYASVDDATTVEGASYFDEAADLLRVGDMVMLNVDTDGAPETRVSGIAGIAGGVVTLGVEPNKAAFVADPSGGATVDTECRAQLAAVIDALIASRQMAAS
jgi:hypothetical protein